MSAEKQPQWWKGIIGLLFLTVVIGVSAWGIIRFENTQSVEDAEENMGGTPTTQVEQCYTPTEKLPFTTGNPRADLTLATVLENNAGTPALTEFVEGYRETGVLDTENTLWVTASEETSQIEGITVRVYVEMEMNGALTIAEDNGTRYVPIVVAPPTDGTETQWDVAGIAKVSNGNAEAVSQQIVVGVRGNAVVIPVETEENSDEQEYGLVSISPIC